MSDDPTRDVSPVPVDGHQNGEAPADMGRSDVTAPQGASGAIRARGGRSRGLAPIPAKQPGPNECREVAPPPTSADQFLATRGFRDWSEFEQQHGRVAHQHFCDNALAGAVLTHAGEIHFHHPRSTAEAVRKVEDLLARCDRLHIEAHPLLDARQRHRCMRTIFSVVKQLLGYLDRPDDDGKELDVRSIERELAEAQRYFRRSAQWNAQLEYFRGVVSTTALLALLIASGIAGLYSYSWWSGCEGLVDDAWQRCDDQYMVPRYRSLAGSAATSAIVGSLVVLLVQARFAQTRSEDDESEDTIGITDDLRRIGRALIRFMGLMAVVGSLGALSVVIGFVTNEDSTGPLLLCLLAGLMGAAVSVMWRMSSGKLLVDYEAPSSNLRFLGGFRPIIGAVFGVILYIFMTIGLIDLRRFITDPSVLLNVYFAVAFLAGFSERLAPDMLDNAARRFSRDEPEGSAERPARGDADRA